MAKVKRVREREMGDVVREESREASHTSLVSPVEPGF